MKRIFVSTLLLTALTPKLVFGGDISGETNVIVVTPDFVSQLSDEARTNHPALRAANARTAAAEANVLTVRTWDDPMATVGGVAAREAMRADEGDIIYGVDQKLPLFGKPGAARRVARAEANVETANAEFQFQTLRTELAKTAFRTALANEVVSIGEQDLAWLGVMTKSIESKYRVNQATLVEVLQIQNEQSRRTTQLQTDRQQLTQEHVALNRLLNRDQQTVWPTMQLPQLAGPVLFNQRLMEMALKYEPKSLMIRQQIKQAEAMVDQSHRERMPDVSVGFEGRNYSGDGSFRQGMFTLSMSIPWGNSGKYRNAVKREQSKLKASELDLADYEAGLREEVHGLTIKIDAARREALLYRDEIIPRSQSALESSRSAWEANQGSLRDVLEARRMLLEARLMQARAISEQYQMLSELVLCCGAGDLTALQMIGADPGANPDFKTK